MKNIFFRSLLVFVVMSILNVEFINLSKRFLDFPYKNIDGILYHILYFELILISLIGIITVLVFSKSYHSIFRVSVLFEILYLLMLMISGINPFLYFTDKNDLNLTKLLFYINSIIILFLMYLVDLMYSKIFSSKTKNLS